MHDFLKRPPIKCIIITLLTTMTSVSLALLGTWDHTQNNFILKIVFFGISVIIYIGALVLYTTIEVNDRRTIEILNNQVLTFEDLLANIIYICQKNAIDINTCIHSIKDSQKFDLNVWSFNKTCQDVCKHIYSSISKLGDSKDYGVSYVKLIEDNNSNTVQMIAYANQDMAKPSIYNKIRCFTDSNPDMYHDLELFKKNSADIDIIVGQEEIDNVFSHKDKESRVQNKGKYRQYIGIPVFCDNRKMIGLLEVVCLKEAKLGLTKDEVKEVASKFLIPYSHVLLILHKIEKALTVGTNVVI